MSEKGLKIRIAFACLEDMKTRFFTMFSQQQRDQAISYGLNSQFFQEQKTKIEYNNSPQADKLRTVSENIQQTKEIMMESLEKLFERGDKMIYQQRKQMLQLNKLSISTGVVKQKSDNPFNANRIFGPYILMVIICGVLQ